MIQLNVANESDYVTCVNTTLGWDARQTKTVTKEPALVQLLKVVTLIDVLEKSSDYMLVGKQMDK